MVIDPQTVTAWVAALTPVISPIMTTLLAILTAFGLKWASDRGQVADNKLNQIHVAVNSKYGAALEIGAGALQRIADLTSDPADKIKAVAAQKLVDDHAYDVKSGK